MSSTIVSADCAVTLVGAGELDSQDLTIALGLAPHIVAADGGARAVLSHGLVPKAVIGDLDSLSIEDRNEIPQTAVHHITEQDSTDFEKVLRAIKAPSILAVGVTGPRLDHTMAVFSALVAFGNVRCVVLGQEEVIFHVPDSITLPTQAGDRVSLFPMRKVTGRSTGLRWPIDGLVLEPGGRVGTSNIANGKARVETDGPGLLAMLPRERLGAVMRLFSAPEATS